MTTTERMKAILELVIEKGVLDGDEIVKLESLIMDVGVVSNPDPVKQFYDIIKKAMKEAQQ